MKLSAPIYFVVLLSLAFASQQASVSTETRLVSLDANGQLVYAKDSQGNRIPDFSHAGYMGGGVRLPDVPVRVTVQPNKDSQDDTARIQEAIDEVSRRAPDARGFRGAVLLARGAYQIGGVLKIAASGVVLRGEGDSADGTVLRATGKPRTLLLVQGQGSWQKEGADHKITDAYVPVGARTFQVDNITGLAVGDTIIVQRPTTEKWIDAIGMNQIKPRADGNPIRQWEPGAGLTFDRVITAIKGREITIDAPLTNALEREYTEAFIYKYKFPGRIEQVGIENLRSNAQVFAQDADYAKSSYNLSVFARVDVVKNGWMRRVTVEQYGNGLVVVGNKAKWITVEDSAFANSAIPETRAGPAGIALVGQLTLVQRCFAEGRHLHAVVTQAWVAGPNVFLDFSAKGEFLDAGPHQRWATGTLYDNFKMESGSLKVENRGNFGSGQGWAGANHLLWNCVAPQILLQQPATAHNWAIGGLGSIQHRPDDGTFEAFGTLVKPRSLYLAQLRERLGEQAVAAIAK